MQEQDPLVQELWQADQVKENVQVVEEAQE